MALDCGCSPQRPALDVDNRGVFCSGSLLDRVQTSNMFPDCKHFVDMSCIYTPSQTMADFELFSNCARNDGSLEFLQMFVEKHFNEPGSELEPWTPPDWKAQPSFLSKVCDPEIKQFAFEVNELWRQMGRRISDDVKENPDHYSIIYIPKPFIIPAADCREYRYWESFWIVRGLLQCGMHQTARGMIENYLVLVQQYGFVPACGRIYCTDRTHPPLLIMMVKAYVEVTKDENFAIQSLPLLETEFETFVSTHSIEVNGRTMYQYRVSSSATPGPRPEAYREDLAAAESINDEGMREKLYTELKSASESGQEFSSRWYMAEGGSNQASLKDTKPSAIVPVELNAIIFRSGKILAEFNRKAGNAKKGDEYQDRSCALVKAIRDVLWNDKAGIWLDYDLVNNQSRNYFCCTNFAPLWARAFPLIDTDKVSKAVMQYIKCSKLDEQYGGVPHTTNRMSGEKWDYPNVFPPMMFLVVEGLDNLGTRASKAMSRRWAHRWVKSNYAAFKKEGFMFEMYNCETFGTAGVSCPKRAAVVGYGWTNAVIIEFLCKYGREINLADDEDKGCQDKSDKKKASYIITSEANMAGQDKGCGAMSTKSLDKSGKSCACATSTTGAKVNKSTAAMGTQSAANCGPQQEQNDDECSCGISQKQSQGPGKSGEEGSCSCGAQQQKQQQQASARSQQPTCCPGCKSAGSARNQDQQTQHSPDCPFAEQHDPDCPCSEAKRKQQQQQKQPACCPGCKSAGSARKQDQQTQHSPDCPFAEEMQHDPDCPCGEAKRKQQQQQKKQQDSDCTCGEEKRKQQQKQPDPDSLCGEEKRKQQQDPECPCAEDRRKQQQQKQQDPECPCAEDRRKQQQQQQQKQQDPSCACGADKDKRNQQPSKPVPCAPSKQQQTENSENCECSAEAKEKIEQLQKQTACYQKQQDVQQERQQQQQQWQRDAQQEDCTPSTKPKPQDCSQQTKKPADTGCGCDADEEQQRADLQEKLTGHYNPLCDREEDDDRANSCEEMPERESGCYGCGNDECPDAPQEDDSGNTRTRSGQQHGADEDCSCSPDPPQPAATAICPHCGGIYTPNPSMHTVGTNKPSLEGCECSGGGGGQQMKGMTSIGLQAGKIDRSGCGQPAQPKDGCDCSGGGGQQSKGMTSMGLQTTNCQDQGRSGTNQRSQTDANCECSGGGQQMQGTNNKMAGRSGTGGGAGQSGCGPCQAHATSEYAPGHGPTPKFNKQFPLKDPVYNTTGPFPPVEEKKKKNKCCNCDEKEE